MTAPSTFSLEESARILLGANDTGDVEPFKVRWLAQRLRGKAQPSLPGYRVGRNWRMTEADIEQAIDLLRPKHAVVADVPAVSGMTRTSRRRLMGGAA